MMKAAIVSAVEMVMIIVLSISKMRAIETVARKTPKYRLASLRMNSVNSVRMSL
jgi:hypothetical protein